LSDQAGDGKGGRRCQPADENGLNSPTPRADGGKVPFNKTKLVSFFFQSCTLV
jgi:hypothetical protein